MFKPESIEKLKIILENNPEYDFQTAQFSSPEALKNMNIESIDPQSEELLAILNAYQRLIRIIPKENKQYALPLLEKGLHSAVQIAGLSKKRFAELTEGIWGEETGIADLIHDNALRKRSRIVIQYMDRLQNNEPHAKAARI